MMVRSFLLTILAMLTIASVSIAQNVIPPDSIIEGNINSDLVLSNTKKYLLRGFVNVNAPATITIPAGTIIFGERSSKGTLIINRGAKINAQGTATSPIVFTSQSSPGLRSPGDWGGIIIAGYASINVPGGTAIIEGGTGTTYGGGSTPNDDDSSGVMRYVRIEFPGIAFLPDNEINGLTLGGVGRKTVLEHIQVSYSGDDSFEWFGGTVNGKYLISFKPVDDDFDTDFGFRGNLQFGFSLRDPNIADISGSNGFESDNDGTGTFNLPRTAPVFSNFTMVGPMPDTSAYANPNHRRGIHLRRSTLTSIYNSIFMGYRTGALLDGANVANAAIGDTLQIRNCIWAGMRAGNGITSNVGTFNAEGWYSTAAYGNRRYIQPSEVRLTSPFHQTNPNPVPQSTPIASPALTGASFSNPRLQHPFFTPTTYVGAFGTGSRWDAGWANYDPQNTSYGTPTSVTNDLMTPGSFYLRQNYPNPFNPATVITYGLPHGSRITLTVYDILGREVYKEIREHPEAGSYHIRFDATGLPSGVYVYRIATETFTAARTMMLLK